MNKLIIGGVLTAVVIGGAIFFIGQQGDQVSTPVGTDAVKEAISPTQAVMEEAKDEMVKEGAMREKVSIDIKDFAYGPKTLTVKKGTTVVWTNQDSVKHTATADDGSFDTGLLAKGESGSVTFDKIGTFNYHCTPHPNMKAAIIVE